MIIRTPVLTRQRARQAAQLQQQQNEEQAESERPNNTANTNGVQQNLRVDDRNLEPEEEEQLMNEFLNVQQRDVQQEQRQIGQQGMRGRFQNIGANFGREELVMGGENFGNGHRNFNFFPRASTPANQTMS